MINYLWLGLVLIAIAFGAGKELFDYPTKETPKPVQITLADDAFPTGEETDIEGETYYSYELDFSDSNSVDIPTNLSISDERVLAELEYNIGKDDFTTHSITGVSVPVDTEDEDLKLEFTIIDDDNEVFLAAGPSFSMESIIPAPENPTAGLDRPITITSIAATSKSGSTASNLSIGIPTYTFDEVSYADGETESWMLVLTTAVADYAEFSIELAIGLIGIMMFWLGLMRIAEAAGLVKFLAKLLKPVMVFLFPDVDPDGDAMGAILMNVAANMLGLGNAATPLGIKAMKELQKENEYKSYASNAQCMLLAINTSSVTLLPATVIGYRAAAGSVNLMEFWPVMIMSTTAATIAAVIATKLLEKLPIFAIPADAEKNDFSETEEGASS